MTSRLGTGTSLTFFLQCTMGWFVYEQFFCNSYRMVFKFIRKINTLALPSRHTDHHFSFSMLSITHKGYYKKIQFIFTQTQDKFLEIYKDLIKRSHFILSFVSGLTLSVHMFLKYHEYHFWDPLEKSTLRIKVYSGLAPPPRIFGLDYATL